MTIPPPGINETGDHVSRVPAHLEEAVTSTTSLLDLLTAGLEQADACMARQRPTDTGDHGDEAIHAADPADGTQRGSGAR